MFRLDEEIVVRVIVKKWGNSASLRIPATVMTAAKLTVDQTVDVREENGRIIIEPVAARTYTLDDLVAGINEANQHEPFDMGLPAGNEVW